MKTTTTVVAALALTSSASSGSVAAAKSKSQGASSSNNAADADQAKPALTKVLALLKDLSGELVETSDKQSCVYKKNREWCANEADENKTQIENSGAKVQDIESFIEEQTAFR